CCYPSEWRLHPKRGGSPQNACTIAPNTASTATWDRAQSETRSGTAAGLGTGRYSAQRSRARTGRSRHRPARTRASADLIGGTTTLFLPSPPATYRRSPGQRFAKKTESELGLDAPPVHG